MKGIRKIYERRGTILMVWNWYDLRFERFTNPSYSVLILRFDSDESTLACMIQQ